MATTKKIVKDKAPAIKKATSKQKKVATPKPKVKPEVKAKAVKTTKAEKPMPEVQSELVKKYRSNVKDTGSVAVQVALLTDRINALAKHLGKHIHDFDSKRGLLILVGKRRRLLNYLRKSNDKEYAKVVTDLKLKK